MSDNEDHQQIPVESSTKPAKPKRQMSEKQLENLAKARAKANESLKLKRERTAKLKKHEKQLKELKMKEREEKVQAELNALTKTVDVNGKEETEPIQYVRKPKKTKKPPKIVYYSSSSEESSPEIEYRKRPKAKKEHPTKPVKERPVPPKPPRYPKEPIEHKLSKLEEDRAIEDQYQQKLRQIRKQYLMQQVFPS